MNHYNAFADWQKLSFIDKKNSNKRQVTNKANDHVVTDGTFLLSNFSQAVSGATNNIEDYITDMMHFLIDDQLHKLHLSGRDVNTGTRLIGVRVNELFSALRRQHEALCQGEEKLSIQNIKKTQDSIKASLDELIPQEEFSMEDRSFFKSEFAVLQTYRQCDWSKFPDVCSLVQAKYEKFIKTYEEPLNKKSPSSPKMK